MVKNPNWKEVQSVDYFYKRGRGCELGTSENKSTYWSEQDLHSGPPNYKSIILTTSGLHASIKSHINQAHF